MKFAKIVFGLAGIWGLVVLTPLYFLFDAMGRITPPAINHPQFYFGFVGVAFAWQIAFLMIASNPPGFRLLMIPAILEKFGYVLSLLILFLQRRITSVEAAAAFPDAILAILFVAAFVRTRPSRGTLAATVRPELPKSFRH